MKKVLLSLYLAFALATPAFALASSSTVIEIKDNRQYLIKRYELTENDNKEDIIEEPFELDGFTYTFINIDEEIKSNDEVKQHTEKIELETASDDANEILNQLKSEITFENEGFKGTLKLDHTSISTDVLGYTSKIITVTDSRIHRNLERNDPSQIPQTITKNGMTLKLSNIDWQVEETMAVDYNAIPYRYTAVAQYAGSYTQKAPTGYVTSANYKGEIIKQGTNEVTYKVTYLGEEIQPSNAEVNKSFLVNTVIPIAGFFILAAVALIILFIRRNVVIYKKVEDEFVYLAHRHISTKNLVVDIRKLKLAEKDELTVLVKERAAKHVFGRQIKTMISDEIETKCIVDKKVGDFWYAFKVTKL